MIADTYGLDAYPWDMQPGETAKSYAAFIAYRNLGSSRSLRGAVIAYYDIKPEEFDPVGGKRRNVARWSSRHHWVKRAEQYDEWLQRMADVEEVEEIKSMRKRHVQIATVVQSKVITYLNGMSDATLLKTSPDALVRMLDIAIKNERLARGVPDSISAVTNKNGGAVEISDITEEALERKLLAFVQAHDPENDLERGEPAGADEEPDDILAAAREVEHPETPIAGAGRTWQDVAEGDEPFPDTAGDDPDDE